MSKFIKSLILLVFTLNCYATENIGIINDDFFTHPDTVVSFRSLIPHRDGYMAIIDGSSTKETKTLPVSPFWKSIFVHNDVNKTSDELIEATVLCGTNKLERSLTLKRAIPYFYVRDVEERTGELIVGATVSVILFKEYKRAGDNSIFRDREDKLYDLKMSLERIVAPDVTVCFKEWVITSQWKRKTRHSRRHYSAMDVYHITTKYPIPFGGLTNVAPEEISREYIRKELKYKSIEMEGPECGTNGGNLPSKAIIM